MVLRSESERLGGGRGGCSAEGHGLGGPGPRGEVGSRRVQNQCGRGCWNAALQLGGSAGRCRLPAFGPLGLAWPAPGRSTVQAPRDSKIVPAASAPHRRAAGAAGATGSRADALFSDSARARSSRQGNRCGGPSR